MTVRRFLRIAAGLLLAAALLCAPLSAANAEGTAYRDVAEDHWAASDIASMTERGLLRGFAEETPESRSAELAQVNAWLEGYCAEREGLIFIDCTDGFVDENGLLLHSLADGVHMDPAYFDLFYDNIARALRATGLVE